MKTTTHTSPRWRCSLSSLFLCSMLSWGGFLSALAQESPAHTTAAPKQDLPPAQGWNGPLSTPAKSLLAQHLHSASFPGEAEVRCGFLEPCALGVARGFTLGGDLLRTLLLPSVGSWNVPGKWLYLDGFVGFQFLNGVDKTHYANGSVGYRRFSYEDSDGRTVASKGLTFRINYAQVISDVYTQGLTFAGYHATYRHTKQNTLYAANADGEGARRTLNRFYAFSHLSPQRYLVLPADIEVVNWKNTHVDLPNHVRGYLSIQPFYAENYFDLPDFYSYREKNFGANAFFKGTYESAEINQAGRFAILGQLGMGFSTVEKALDAKDHSGVHSEPPRRNAIGFLAELMGSYQF